MAKGHPMQNPEVKDTYTKDEAAQRLGIGYVTLHRQLLKTGVLRSIRVGSRVLIPKAELERFLASKPDAA